jgi:hypothetical protein
VSVPIFAAVSEAKLLQSRQAPAITDSVSASTVGPLFGSGTMNPWSAVTRRRNRDGQNLFELG